MRHALTQRKPTSLATGHVERAMAPWNATARSAKRGALRRAASIAETHGSDPQAIPQVAERVDPFDLHQKKVRYLGRCRTMLTQVSSLAALV
ncbi:hypothetical protein TcYC6_0109210 [Trypanosoma cruzi]|nr:hypothetical protein TcYC6_0109210 [Trypanosoma cruzi]